VLPISLLQECKTEMKIRANFPVAGLILCAGLACGQTTPETHNGSEFNKVLWTQSPLKASVAEDLLLTKQRRLLDYEQDFLDFQKSSTPSMDPEYEIATNLEDSASMAEDQLDAASTLLEIYHSMSCEEDPCEG
jgi:hypothetical protein